MKLEELIKTIEDNYLEEAVEKLAKSPKDLITLYANLKEFERAKLMRASHLPETNEKDAEIQFKLASGNPNYTDLPENSGS